ncbi:DUF4424 family protein [Aestuariivirga sp.]|uniref:DUF4424 family protein n=1 Tax=Aestuariivirga sp. TaxID=2650926 RepID=UPI0025C0D491|nr:DUF4424 family protein [Aestuariivirga sp.]MCA3555261.1 DUF4424 domain-containing protein [Aestuariivirga sp.]
MKRTYALAVLALLACMAAPRAEANDSMAETPIGGLVLTRSSSIALDREDLFISPEEVRVDYLFTNTGTEDIETLVAFPLPDQDYNSESVPAYNLRKELGFHTTVDGAPVQYQIVLQAIAGGKDVTDELAEAGLDPDQDWNALQASLRALDPAKVEALRKRGLIVEEDGGGEGPVFSSTWKIRTIVTRKQVFPAGRTVAVSHRYKPLAGGSVGGSLYRQYRNETLPYYKEKYCVEDSWIAALDKTVARRTPPGQEFPEIYTETWLGYVLSSGANWKGPIRDFRLVIDKGRAENMVSFCAEGVKKISPTRFEVRKTDFEPREDLNILIVEWIKPE